MKDLTKAPAATGTSSELAEMSGPTPTDPRLDRITRYRESALNKSDDLEANLSVINADLMGMANQLRRELEEANERLPNSAKKLELRRRGFDDYLRVTKQIERYTTLVIRFGAAGNENRLPPK
jgi:hypothetical protein